MHHSSSAVLCPLLPVQTAEDIEHVLLECHAYDPARYQLVNALKSLVNPTNDASWSLLAPLSVCVLSHLKYRMFPRDRTVVLSISAAFLSAIDSVRKI